MNAFKKISGLLLVGFLFMVAPNVCTAMDLHTACREGLSDRIAELVESGADVDARDSYGRTPLFVASQYGHTDCVRALIELRAYCDDLRKSRWVAMFGYTKDVDTLFATKDYLNAALFVASKNGHVDCLQALIDAADCSDGEVPLTAYSALTIACLHGHAGCVEALIAAGVEFDRIGEEDYTHLMLAALMGNYACLLVLIKAGADVNFNNGVDSALTYASYSGSYDCAKALIDAGANKEWANSEGETALKIAQSRGHRYIIGLLSPPRQRMSRARRKFLAAQAQANSSSTTDADSGGASAEAGAGSAEAAGSSASKEFLSAGAGVVSAGSYATPKKRSARSEMYARFHAQRSRSNDVSSQEERPAFKLEEHYQVKSECGEDVYSHYQSAAACLQQFAAGEPVGAGAIKVIQGFKVGPDSSKLYELRFTIPGNICYRAFFMKIESGVYVLKVAKKTKDEIVKKLKSMLRSRAAAYRKK